MIVYNSVSLDIPVYVFHPMYRIDCQYHLCSIELQHIFGEVIFVLTEKRKKITTAVVVHHEVLKMTKYRISKMCKSSCNVVQKKTGGTGNLIPC